jgi:hypothetical protein
MFYQAYDLFDKGKYHECIPVFLDIANTDADKRKVYWSLIFLGRCSLSIGKHNAIEFFERAMEIFPDRAEAIFEAGKYQHLLGNKKESERLLRSISSCKKPISCIRYEGEKYFEAPYELLIEIFMEQNRFNDAEEVTNGLLKHGDQAMYDVKRAEYNNLYSRHFNNVAMEFVKAKTIERTDTLVIQLPSGYDGLGDNLVFSHIPRIAKQFGGFKQVLVSNRNAYKGPGYAEMVWEKNPYVDGFTEQEGTYSSIQMNRLMDKWNNIHPSINLMDGVMMLHNLDDGSRGNVPECYYRPNLIETLRERVILDIGAKTIDLSKLNLDALIGILERHGIMPDCIISPQEFNGMERISPRDIWDWADTMFSAKTYICFNSGGYWLSKALGIKAKHIWIEKKNLPSWSYLDHENIVVKQSTIFL